MADRISWPLVAGLFVGAFSGIMLALYIDVNVGVHSAALLMSIVAAAVSGAMMRPKLTFPRVWGLFRFLLPKRTRERIYEPAHNDLLALYVEAKQQRYQTRWARRWLSFCFTVQTLWLVLKCYRAVAAGAIAWGLWRVWQSLP